ncbi:MAG: hypothetical protein DRQ39_06640, partial [Gammaproteobacteria bacterium]
SYKEFDLLTHYSVLLKTSNTCKDILIQDSTFKETIYKEIIYKAFRPKVKLDDFYETILKYICCNHGFSPGGQINAIVSNINIEDEDESYFDCFEPPISKYVLRNYPYKLVGKSETSMDLPSKLNFLTPRETELLIGIQEIISRSPNKTSYDFSYSEFIDFVMEDEFEMKLRDRIDEMLNTLVFYEFITRGYKQTEKGDDHYHSISLNDPEVYEEFFNQIGYSQSA